MSVNVRISGVGGSSEVTVEDGSTLDVALSEVGIDAEDQGLSASVNGESVLAPEDVELSPGDQVTVTARDVKLG